MWSHPMADWQPIKTAPTDGTEILLVHCGGGTHYGIGMYSKVPTKMGWGELLWDWKWGYPPTHWMPLPDPPVADEEG
jgi:hypothetical protein